MRKIVFVVLSVIPAIAFADTKKIPITADVGICAHRNEVSLNTGKNSRIRIKGNEHYYLFNFDTKPIRNWKITKATLHLKLARGHLRKAAFCTVPSKWVEGTARNKPQKGSTCFTHLKYPDKPWTQWGLSRAKSSGGTMLDATFNSPYMMWKTSDVKTGKAGWLEIPIAPELIQAVVVGLSHGLVMSDEKGQTRENHDVYTREQGNAKPYITVEGGHLPAKPISPKMVYLKADSFPAGADLRTGTIRIDTTLDMAKLIRHDPYLGKSVLGTKVRVHLTAAHRETVCELVTLADPIVIADCLKPGKEYYLSAHTYTNTNTGQQIIRMLKQQDYKVVASPALTIPKPPKLKPLKTMKRVHEHNGWRVELLPATAKASPNGKPVGQSIPITPRNAWVGLQVVITPPGGKADGISVRLAEVRGIEAMRTMRLFSFLKYRLYRVWHVPKGKDWHAEVLVSLKAGEKFDIPWAANKVPNQVNQAIFIDMYVPPRIGAGGYTGRLIVSRHGKDVFDVPIAIEVSPVALPDKFNIVGDMNAYSSPARAMGVKNSDPKAFMEMERKYYRLAHSHRMTLNVLPYSQSGSINWRAAPKIAGKGKDVKITDWSEWDERYGPLLSGETFTKKHGYIGPGEGVPIHHMYLPLHENWPAKLADHFNQSDLWPPPKNYKEFLQWTAELPMIENYLGGAAGSFEHAWHMVLRQFRLHAHHKKWRHTRYHVYLNNKYYFRNREKGFGRGISLWLLDEPMFTDDFLALRYFGRLTRGMAVGDIVSFDFDFRIDISRPAYQRNWLDGVVDLNVCAGQLYKQRRLIAYRKRKFGEEYWNYKMPPSFEANNVAWTVWPVRSYCWGANGTLPWQTIASDGDLTKADATALMYPGRKFGLTEPVPSLRMKAWRDGIQTTELLRMLKTKMKWNDIQLRAFVGQVCNLDGWKDGIDPKENSSIVTFNQITPQTLTKLKHATILMLSKKKT